MVNLINFVVLQIGSVPTGAGSPSQATLLFYRTIRALLPQVNRAAINYHEDDEN